MTTLLLRNAAVVVTMDENRREIEDGGVFIRGHLIEAVGRTAELPSSADQVLDLRGKVVLPGLVNTHHHLYQTLTRCLPAAQDAPLFSWLQTLYPIWARLTPEAVYVSALVGLAELVLTGCTTTVDQLYLFPNGSRVDDEIRAASELGVRFHPCRGSMSLGESEGGLPPDEVVEDEETILADSRRVIETFHDPARHSMCRVMVAPCSPFSVTPELLRSSRDLARQYGVHCHTHVAETLDEEEFCLEKYGRRPVEYLADLGWLGDDVSYAHGVHLTESEMELFAETGTGVAHCPTSNMRLGSGIAPVARMLELGVKVGLAVDGSASNDSSHMLNEARMALMLQRVRHGPEALSARQVLEMATLGGASLLGRDDIGALAPGKAADLIAIDVDRLEYAGAGDLVAALLFCAPPTVDLSVVNGRVLVDNGQLQGLDLEAVLHRHNDLAVRMWE
ncbi:MAG TPA: 8-oxoguanine deaminase [Anaerolineae bacterium]|nr:8-oxoguanine deaminase [Anaerolineae bacterium]